MNNISNENHSKSEIIDSCGMDEKTNDYAEPTKGERKKTKQTWYCCRHLVTSITGYNA